MAQNWPSKWTTWNTVLTYTNQFWRPKFGTKWHLCEENVPHRSDVFHPSRKTSINFWGKSAFLWIYPTPKKTTQNSPPWSPLQFFFRNFQGQKKFMLVFSVIFSFFFQGSWVINLIDSHLQTFQNQRRHPVWLSQNYPGMTVACCSQTNPTKPSKILKRAPWKAEETGKVLWPGFLSTKHINKVAAIRSRGPRTPRKKGPHNANESRLFQP